MIKELPKKFVVILRDEFQIPELTATYDYDRSYGTYINCTPSHGPKGIRLGSSGNDLQDAFNNLMDAITLWRKIGSLPKK